MEELKKLSWAFRSNLNTINRFFGRSSPAITPSDDIINGTAAHQSDI